MPLVWIDGKNDTEADKNKIKLVQNVIASVKAGYKDDGQDFYRLVEFLESLFATQRIIEDISAASTIGGSVAKK